MLAILTTHPIQYQIPLWRALAAERSIPFEVWYLTDHGIRPTYDREFGRTFAWDIDTLSGYPHRFLRANRNASLSGFSKLRLQERFQKLIQDRGVTSLWVQGWQVAAYWQAVRQAHSAGVPVWLRGDSNDLAQTRAWKLPIKRVLLGQFFRRVEQFLYVGQANRRLYEKFGVSSGKLHPAPHCVDNDSFALQADSLRSRRTEIRRAWNIPEDAFCVLFAGKFIPKKRPLDLVAAVRNPLLENQGRPLHILFVGAGELAGELRTNCSVAFDGVRENAGQSNDQNDGTRPRASFTGFLNQTEISRAFVAADCLALPSDHRETWGLIVNEAMASGLPCITSDACGCSEDLVAPINPEFRYKLGDTTALANALLTLMKQPCSPAVLREHVSKFSVSATVETVKWLYQSRTQDSRAREHDAERHEAIAIPS